MYAVIRTGGKQYKVAEGDWVDIEKLDADVGATVNFEDGNHCWPSTQKMRSQWRVCRPAVPSSSMTPSRCEYADSSSENLDRTPSANRSGASLSKTPLMSTKRLTAASTLRTSSERKSVVTHSLAVAIQS